MNLLIKFDKKDRFGNKFFFYNTENEKRKILFFYLSFYFLSYFILFFYFLFFLFIYLFFFF